MPIDPSDDTITISHEGGSFIARKFYRGQRLRAESDNEQSARQLLAELSKKTDLDRD